MIYSMIALLALSFVLIAVNFKNKYTWFFTLLTIGLDLSLFSLISHITRTLNYGYPHIPLFKLDYSIYLYISRMKISYYDLIYILNLGISIVIFSLFLITDRFTWYKYHGNNKKWLLKYMLLILFITFYLWFYSPSTSLRFYVNVNQDSGSDINFLFDLIRCIDLLINLIIFYLLFRPILITFHEYHKTSIAMRKYQSLTLTVSLLVLIVLFVLIIISGPFRPIYFFSNNPVEIFLWPSSRIPMPFIFYRFAPFALLITVIFFPVAMVRNHVVDFGDQLRKFFISRKLGEMYRNIRGVLHSHKNTLFRIKILVDQLGMENNDYDKDYILNELQDVMELSFNNLSRILDSLKELRIRPKVSNIVESLEMSLKRLAHNETITIEKDYKESEIYSNIDSYHLTEVFYNILENAIDALDKTLKQNKIIRVEVKQEHEWNVINIIDNASGIEKRKIRKMFEPFYSTKTSDRNIGLGLPYTKRIIKMHFGTINVKSTVGSGTTVQIVLPRYVTDGKNE